MRISVPFRKILLSVAIAVGLIGPWAVASPAFAQHAMVEMEHATIALDSCLSQHQSPVGPVTKVPDQLQDTEDKDPTPPASSFFLALIEPYVERKQTGYDRVNHPPLRPPDIVIAHATLRM